MTLGEYIKQGGRYYQKLHMGNDLWNYVLKGINYSGEPSEDFKQEAQDIKEGKSYLLFSSNSSIFPRIVMNFSE